LSYERRLNSRQCTAPETQRAEVPVRPHGPEASCSDLAATAPLDAGHVHEPAVVALKRYGYRGRRPVPVLSHDEVGLTGPRRLPLVCVLPVQQDHHVRVLLDRSTFT